MGICEASHDNIATALAILHFHEKEYALTGGAIRRLIYLIQQRGPARSSWTVGFRRLAVAEYIRPDFSQTVFGHNTWRITQKGRERLLGAGIPALTREATDPFAYLEDAERYKRTTPYDNAPGASEDPAFIDIDDPRDPIPQNWR